MLTLIAVFISGFNILALGLRHAWAWSPTSSSASPSDFFTGDDKSPSPKGGRVLQNGPAFTILNGQLRPALLPAGAAGIGLTALISYKLGEAVPGIRDDDLSTAAIGMLSIIGMIISNDAYGPIVDNARGVAEMANLGDEVLEITDELDAAGNTAKAITKGFSIGAAGLTVISLLGAFLELVEGARQARKPPINVFDVMNPWSSLASSWA